MVKPNDLDKFISVEAGLIDYVKNIKSYDKKPRYFKIIRQFNDEIWDSTKIQIVGQFKDDTTIPIKDTVKIYYNGQIDDVTFGFYIKDWNISYDEFRQLIGDHELKDILLKRYSSIKDILDRTFIYDQNDNYTVHISEEMLKPAKGDRIYENKR